MSIGSSFNGVRVLLRDARELAENTRGLSKAEQRRLDQWLNNYEAEVAERQVAAYTDAAERNVALYGTLVDDLTGLSELADRIAADVQHGRKDPREGRQQLTSIFRGIRQIREQITTLQESDARAWEEVQRDPAEVQAEITNKYGLRDSLPVFSEEILTGE